MHKRIILSYCFILVAFVVRSQGFTLFNSIRYNNTPSNKAYMSPIVVTSQSALVSPYVTTNAGPTDNLPNYPAVDSLASSLKTANTPIATLDIEVWPYYPTSTMNRSITWYKNVVDSFKKINPTTQIGYYGVVPNVAYQWSKIDPVNNPSGYSSWDNINKAYAPVANKVDIIFPSFYAYDTDTSAWRKMVDSTVSAVKRYYGATKPIYAYIWPQYHDGSAYNLQFIDTVSWKFQLKILKSRTNGCVIWTSNKDANGNIINWNENMPWWLATKSFMVTNGLVPPLVFDKFYVAQTSPNIQLQWATSNDTTTNYFILQRSNDGVTYSSVSGNIPFSGSYYTLNTYTFTDNTAASGKVYYRVQAVSRTGTSTYSSAISYSPATPAFTPGNIAVLRIGGLNKDGSNGGNPASAGAFVHIDELDAATGNVVSRTDLPQAVNGLNKAYYNSVSTTEGLLTSSPNGQYISSFGYSAKPSSGTIYGAGSSTSPRTVALIKYDGSVNTSTSLTDYPTNGTAATTGSAVTTDGTNIWLAAAQTNGIAYTTTGTTSGATFVAATNTSNRSVSIFGNDLYFVAAGGIRIGTVAAGGGIPTTTGNTMTTLNINGPDINNASPNQVLMLDMNASIPGADVMYISNNGSTNTAGILKYCKDANGQWQPYGSYGNTTAAPAGQGSYLGITGSFSGSTVTLYVSCGAISSGTATNNVIKLTDASGYNGTMNATAIWSVSSPGNSQYRGVAYVPVPSFYYAGSGELNDINNWGTNTDGSGGNPLNFTNDYQTFYITAGNPNMSNDWVVSGNGSKIVVGDGSNPVTVNIPANAKITGIIDVQKNATLNIANTINPSFGNLYTGSTVDFTGNNITQVIPSAVYSNLIIDNPATCIVTGTSTVNDLLTINNGKLMIGDGNANSGNLTLATKAKTIISASGVLSIPGNGTVNFNNTNISILSNSQGAGAIDVVAGIVNNWGNVSMQCYISSQRGFRTLGHPFNSNMPLTNLTGSVDITGSGGVVNGFTTSTNNTPSAYYYDNTTDQWAAYTSTLQNWNKLQGLLLFVRGNKGEGLNGPENADAYSASNGPSAITLNLTGKINTGNVNYTTGSNATWNFVGNPYPAPIDITKIGNLGIVAGNANAVYLWQPYQQAPYKASAGGQYVVQDITNAPVVIPAFGGFFIKNASGQATSLNFTESVKNISVSPINLLGMPETTDTSVTLEIKSTGHLYTDQLLLRFNKSSSENGIDITDWNKFSNAYLDLSSITPDNKRLAMDTRPLRVTDTTAIKLSVNSAVPDSFSITIKSGHHLPDSMIILLRDNKTGTDKILNNHTAYFFTGEARDSADANGNRFTLLLYSNKPVIGMHADNVESSLSMIAYPTPFTNATGLHIVIKSAGENTVVQIVSAAGIIMDKIIVAPNTRTLHIDGTRYPKGMYTIRLTDTRGSISKQVIKQ